MKLTKEQKYDAKKMADTPDLPNFSKPGTGKTHTTLEAMRLTGAEKHLIVCPKIALTWWQEQAAAYLGADARIIKTGNSPLKGDCLITTYGIARNAADRFYDHFRGTDCTMTLDESHNLANPEAMQTQAIFGAKLDLVGGLAERFDTVWCLTGTPQQNHANDYYTQTAVLHPDVYERYGIRNYDHFCKRFTYKQQRQYHPRMRPVWKIVGSSNLALLHNIVYHEIGAIRRLEAPGLPPLRERELSVPVKINAEMKRVMKDMTSDQILKEFNDPDSPIAKLWHAIGMAKVPEVVPYVGDCAKDGPILLGCWHRDVMAEYAGQLAKTGLTVAQVHGNTSDKDADHIRSGFNSGAIDVVVGQMKKMGVSWNIQEASNHVIVAEVYPSPSVYEQFYKRVYRFGQKNACTVDLVLGDTELDYALNDVRKRKAADDERITSGE